MDFKFEQYDYASKTNCYITGERNFIQDTRDMAKWFAETIFTEDKLADYPELVDVDVKSFFDRNEVREYFGSEERRQRILEGKFNYSDLWNYFKSMRFNVSIAGARSRDELRDSALGAGYVYNIDNAFCNYIFLFYWVRNAVKFLDLLDSFSEDLQDSALDIETEEDYNRVFSPLIELRVLSETTITRLAPLQDGALQMSMLVAHLLNWVKGFLKRGYKKWYTPKGGKRELGRLLHSEYKDWYQVVTKNDSACNINKKCLSDSVTFQAMSVLVVSMIQLISWVYRDPKFFSERVNSKVPDTEKENFNRMLIDGVMPQIFVLLNKDVAINGSAAMDALKSSIVSMLDMDGEVDEFNIGSVFMGESLLNGVSSFERYSTLLNSISNQDFCLNLKTYTPNAAEFFFDTSMDAYGVSLREVSWLDACSDLCKILDDRYVLDPTVWVEKYFPNIPVQASIMRLCDTLLFMQPSRIFGVYFNYIAKYDTSCFRILKAIYDIDGLVSLSNGEFKPPRGLKQEEDSEQEVLDELLGGLRESLELDDVLAKIKNSMTHVEGTSGVMLSLSVEALQEILRGCSRADNFSVLDLSRIVAIVEAFVKAYYRDKGMRVEDGETLVRGVVADGLANNKSVDALLTDLIEMLNNLIGE